LSKRITKAFTRAGLTTSEEREGRKQAVNRYGAHSLRHFFVTAAAAAGLPAPVIKSITGHTTDTMMEHYQHLTADYAGEIAKRITGTTTKALPAPVSDADAIRAKVKELAEKLTNKNAKTIRAAMLAL
jgi:integrase